MRAHFYGLLAVAAACVDPPFPKPDGGEDVIDCDGGASHAQCDPYSAERYVHTEARAICRFALSCCETADQPAILSQWVSEQMLPVLLSREPLMFAEQLACRRAVAWGRLVLGRESFLALDEGRRGFDRDAAEQCLRWLEQGAAQCAPGLALRFGHHRPAACDRVLYAATPPGGECRADDDCAASADGGVLLCHDDTHLADAGLVFSLKGRCAPALELGAACPLPAGRCAFGAFCGTTGRCEARQPAGGVCVGAPCVETAYCDRLASPARCQPRVPALSPCRADAECEAGATCSATFSVCIVTPDPDPLDITFAVCVRDGGVALARSLPNVPQDGGGL